MHVSNATGTVEHLSGTESLPQEQNALLVEVADVDGRSPGQRMQRGHCHQDTDREQQTPVELIVASAERQGQVNLATLDETGRADATLFDEMDVNARPRSQVPCQERCQHALDDLRRGSDAKAPDLTTAHHTRPLGELVDAIEDLAAPTHEAFSLARQMNPTTGALEEPHTQFHLEVVNLPPQRGLGDPQATGGSGESARLRDRDEVPEVTELHAGCCLGGIG